MRTWLIVGLWSLFAASGLFSQPQTHIDHLKPIPAYGEFGYGEAVFRALIKERLPELWMIVRPSFSPEYTVVLGRIWHNGGIRRELAGYQLRWAKAKEALWNWKTLSDGTMELDLRRHPELHEKSTDFPVEAG
ncbi:MAG: hypothetical protein HKM89_02425, partial [Gemmatimonadales bacterium]|nr:hypothetical protein [Gemmatimonadales bacterium]